MLIVSCCAGLFPYSPVTSTGPCSQPWLAAGLSLWVCCWRTAWVWGISCRTRKLCVSSTNSCPAASFSASWPNGSTDLAEERGKCSTAGVELARGKWSPWFMCRRRCGTCWAVSPSPSTLPPPRQTTSTCPWRIHLYQWVCLSITYCAMNGNQETMKNPNWCLDKIFWWGHAIGISEILAVAINHAVNATHSFTFPLAV